MKIIHYSSNQSNNNFIKKWKISRYVRPAGQHGCRGPYVYCPVCYVRGLLSGPRARLCRDWFIGLASDQSKSAH